MQWTGDRNAGFSRADPSQLYQPLILDPIYNYQAINVESQTRTPSSLLNWLRSLIHVRKRHPLFGKGDLRFVPCTNQHVVAYVRQFAGATALVVNNLSRFAQPACLDLHAFQGCIPIEMLGDLPFPAIGSEPYFVSLSPHGFFWLLIQAVP